MKILIESLADVEQHMLTVSESSEKTKSWLNRHTGNGIELIRALKFKPVGCHPIGGYNLNAIEQINQTFTYLVALAAAKQLLKWHPDVGGFWLAPGAHMALPLDIMSVSPGIVGAETFAAVSPSNNGKLARDLKALSTRNEKHRYVFLSTPKYPHLEHLSRYDIDGIQVWAVEV